MTIATLRWVSALLPEAGRLRLAYLLSEGSSFGSVRCHSPRSPSWPKRAFSCRRAPSPRPARLWDSGCCSWSPGHSRCLGAPTDLVISARSHHLHRFDARPRACHEVGGIGPRTGAPRPRRLDGIVPPPLRINLGRECRGGGCDRLVLHPCGFIERRRHPKGHLWAALGAVISVSIHALRERCRASHAESSA